MAGHFNANASLPLNKHENSSFLSYRLKRLGHAILGNLFNFANC